MQRLKTSVVPPEGPLDASICMIGQAPGAEENLHRRPFIGGAGQLLNRCLRQVGLARSSVLINNVFSQQPPRNNIGYYFQDKNCTRLTWEGEEHVERLRAWLVQLKQRRDAGINGPNIIVAFGREALMFLTGHKRITKWRGSVLPCTLVPGFKIYPTFHPSYVNRLINEPEASLFGEKKKQQQNALPLFLIDLKRIIEQSEFPEIRTPKRKFEVDLTFHEIAARLESLALLERGLVAVDIETLPGETGPVVWMIGFAASPSGAFVVPIIQNQRLVWAPNEEVVLWQLISKLFLNPKVKKGFQGGMYDLSVLGRNYGLRLANGTYEDTMLCHHASYPYIRKALETLVSIYTWEPYFKDEGKVHYGKRSSDRAEALYNCKDTTCTREILPIVHRNAHELGTWEGYNRTLSVVPSLLGMMIRGVRIDQAKKDRLNVEFQKKATYHQTQFNELVGQEVNLNSPDQVKKIFYGYYGLPLQYNHKTKKPTIGKDAAQKLLRGATGERKKILQHYLDFKKFSKLASTYTTMEVDADGRIHTSYSFISTWRLSSSESPFGKGGNLQNIPKGGEEGKMIRSLFIPDSGKVMIAADYRQAEAMVVAWEAEDIPAINAFLAGEDTHWLKTRDIFGIPENIKYNKQTAHRTFFTPSLLEGDECSLAELRDIGKICKHAGNYGTGPVMFQTSLARAGFHIELRIAKQFIQRFKHASPFIMAWQREIREKIKATRILISSYGRKREFMGRLNDNLFRAAYAFSPQNTVGEITQVSGREINKRFSYIDLLMNVHDEVIVQVDPDRVEEAIEDIRSCMEQTLVIKGRELTIPVDFRVGKNWGELEEVK